MRVVWTLLLHAELCGLHCYMQSYVDFTVTCRVVWTSLLHAELCELHCYMQSYVDFTVT